MPPDDSFHDLMDRLTEGDSSAAGEVFHRFFVRLVGLARVHLDSRLRQKVDPEDVVQSVFRSFFLRHADGQFDLEGWDGLWALLTTITLRKCHRWREHFHTAARDLQAEVEDPRRVGEEVGREPTPEEAVILAEQVELLLRGLEGRDRDIVSLRLQGYLPGEISARLGRPERTVYRVLDRVKRRLRRLRDSDPDPS
jgi:RNA polymerase sigma-70 factor (ECF subfamily)